MDLKYTLLTIFLIIVAFLLGLFFDKLVFTGNVVEENNNGNYIWTKAICNEDNECIDVLVECSNGEVISIEPASELKDFNDNWKDPRGEFAKTWCER